MARPRIGVQTVGLQEPLRQALATACRLGAEGVELDARHEVRPDDFPQTAVRHLRKLLDDLRLSVTAMALPTRSGFGDAARLEARIAAAQSAMRLASRMGCSMLLVGGSDAAADPDGPAGGLAREVLSGLANYGLRIGTRLVLGCGASGSEGLARFLDTLPEGVLAASLDPAALVLGGESPLKAVATLGSKIAYVYGTDAVGLSGGRVQVALGRGSADIAALVAALEQQDYRGWICVASHGASAPQQDIAHAIEYLKGL